MMTSLWRLMTCVVMMSMLLLSGCETSAQKRARLAAAEGKVLIEFWHALFQEHQAVIEDLVEKFQEENPDIVIDPIYQGNYSQLKLNLNNSLAAGRPPHLSLMYEGWTAEFVENGSLKAVQDFLDELETAPEWLDDMFEGFRQNNSAGERLLTLPFNKSTFLLFYNVERLAAAGFDTPPQTIDELFQMASRLTERNAAGGITFYGVGIRSTLEPFTVLYFALGGRYMTEAPDGSRIVVNTPEATEALNIIRRLVLEDRTAFMDGGFMSSPFGSERVAMFWDSSAGIPFALRGAGDKFTVGTASVPTRENGGFLSQGTNIGMFNTGTPEQQQAAWRFLEFLMRPDNAALWAARTGYLPVRRAALDEPVLSTLLEESPAYRACIDQLDRLAFEPALSFWEQIRGELAEELEAAYRGRRSVQDALTNAEQRSQSIIRRAGRRAATSAP